FREENLGTMALPDLLVWGEQNGHDSSFLDGTYTGEIINATETAYTRYSGENMFRGTPAVYINGTQIDNDSAMSPRDLRDAIESAGAGEVESEPMEDGDANKDPGSHPRKRGEPESSRAVTLPSTASEGVVEHGRALAAIPSPEVNSFSLGPLDIHFYALCILAGVVVAVLWSERRWAAMGGEKGTIMD